MVWNGLQRLEVVSVTLDQGRDEPQLVFESMNSTGLDLETSDLVRNYMLMGCPMVEQNTLYADYWLPMERTLGNLSFDAFLHDWMVVTLKKPVPKGRAMYSEFKRFAADSSMPRMELTRNLLENMLEYAGYYAIIKGVAAAGSGDTNVDYRLESIQDLDSTVTDPLVMYMFAAWKHHRTNRDGLLRMLADLESYLFRRMVCSVSSNGLNKLVPSLIAKLESAEHDLAETFAALLLTETAKATRMPTDEQFRQRCSARICTARLRAANICSPDWRIITIPRIRDPSANTPSNTSCRRTPWRMPNGATCSPTPTDSHCW